MYYIVITQFKIGEKSQDSYNELTMGRLETSIFERGPGGSMS